MVGLVAEIDVQVLEHGVGIGVARFLVLALGLDNETGLLEAHGTFGEPGVASHFGFRDYRSESRFAPHSHEFPLDVVGGLFGSQEALEQVVVFGLVFRSEDTETAAQAMRGSI